MEYKEGIIVAVLFKNDENGYAVIKIETNEGEEITATGIMPNISKGIEICFTGSWQPHKSYGDQFVIEDYEISLPETESAMIEYLGSRTIKGVGIKLAEKIVKRFGQETFEVIEKHPNLLTEIRGISEEKALEIQERFLNEMGLRHVIEFVIESKLPITLATKIYKKLGIDAKNIIEENPYVLCEEYYAVDFSVVDEYALSHGLSEDNKERIKAGILFVLKHNISNGHAFIPKEKLITSVADFLEIDTCFIDENIIELHNKFKIRIEDILNIEAVYLIDIHSAECFITSYLTELSDYKYEYDFEIDELISSLETDNGIEYEEKQKKAIRNSAQSGLMILTGGPGTGKTTTVKGILEIFYTLGLKVELCAPTGRASKRLSDLCGTEAKTIHRLLESTYSLEDGQMIFQKNLQNQIDADAIIIDESSMIDITLIFGLLKALKLGTRVVFVGDPDQLPPVGAGNFLKDIIRSEKFNVIMLTEIFRQAKESLIVTNAHAVNKGIIPISNNTDGDFFFLKRYDEESITDTVAELYKTRIPKSYMLEHNQIQVICPTKKGKAGTIAMNKRLQEEINPMRQGIVEKRFGDIIFRTGDRVMQIKNNYDIEWTKGEKTGTGMFNGDIGIIEKFNISDESLEINFDDRMVTYTFSMLNQLDLAYALTVHKAQGSEFDAVILAISNTVPKLLTRRILYTAITRAKKLLIMAGSEQAVEKMVSSDLESKRYSGLKKRIEETSF